MIVKLFQVKDYLHPYDMVISILHKMNIFKIYFT